MDFTRDIAGFGASLALLVSYQGYLHYRLSKDPGYTVQRVNNLVRSAWVEEIMRRRDGILAVQTLRNSMMAAVFLASTAVLMIIGVLTLSEQGDKLRTGVKALTHALRVFCLLLLAAALTGCGGSTAKLSKLPADAVVLAFGDSLTFGTGAQTETSYPALLEKLIGRKVWSAGVPGEASAAGLARLPSVLDYYQPKLLILCHGGNDFLRKLGDTQAADNLRAMIRLARERGIDVVLIAVPKPGLFPSPPDFYAEIAKEFRMPYEDAALKAIMRDNELKSDIAHPNARGYARLAEAIAALLKRSGAV